MKFVKPEWDERIGIVFELIHALYSVPSGQCGGCCHIVTDDDNINDDSLKFIIDKCETEYKDRVESKLCKIICEYLLEISFEQRLLLFILMASDNYDSIDEFTWNHLSDDEIEIFLNHEDYKDYWEYYLECKGDE